jgi:hypothetical protein
MTTAPLLSTSVAAWLQGLGSDHAGGALNVAKIVGSLMIENGPSEWHKLSRISALAGQPNAGVAAILYRMRGRGHLRLEHPPDHDVVDPEYRFVLLIKIGSSRFLVGGFEHFS